MNHFRAGVLLSAFLVSAVTILSLQAVALGLQLPAARTLPHRYYKFLSWLLGFRVTVHGEMIEDGPVLIAANHVSYFDVLVLGSVGPVSFIAKSEVAGWPLFGWGATLFRSVYVDRTKRQRALHDRDQIQKRLAEGDTLVIFPEGTSTDGNRVLPFKSSLMSVAELDLKAEEAARGQPFRVRVQPVSIAYTRLNGMPMGRRNRPIFAWYGDMGLLDHLWEALAAGPFDAVVHLHPPVTVEQMGDRKALTRYCEAAVRAGVAHALSGRDGLPVPAFGGVGATAPALKPGKDKVAHPLA